MFVNTQLLSHAEGKSELGGLFALLLRGQKEAWKSPEQEPL